MVFLEIEFEGFSFAPLATLCCAFCSEFLQLFPHQSCQRGIALDCDFANFFHQFFVKRECDIHAPIIRVSLIMGKPRFAPQLCFTNSPFLPVSELYSVSVNLSLSMNSPDHFFQGSRIFSCFICSSVFCSLSAFCTTVAVPFSIFTYSRTSSRFETAPCPGITFTSGDN